MAEIDPRCFQHDHHFLDEDFYDEDSEGMTVALPSEVQLRAKCARCGVTMRQSLFDLMADCRQLLDRTVN